MSSTEQRYKAAIAYVLRAIDRVESVGFNSSLVDLYAARLKTEPVRNELGWIEGRWLRATNDVDRARIARDAELLADRTEESLPGAPQTWPRTNFWKGEQPTSTPATSFAQELEKQAGDSWDWAATKAGDAARSGSSIAKWLLLGGGLLIALKLFHDRRAREDRARGDSQQRLSDELVDLAEKRNANGWVETMCPICHRYKRTDQKGRLVTHEYPSGGICPGSGKAPLVSVTRAQRRS